MKLWMFQQPERVYQPAVATEGWDGPGAYVTERQEKKRAALVYTCAAMPCDRLC